MNAQQMSDAIGRIHESIIEETLEAKCASRAYAPHPRIWPRVLAATACVCLAVGLAFASPYLLPDGNVNLPASNPEVTVTTTSTTASGTGGDMDSCEIHSFMYHTLDADFSKYVGKEKHEAYCAAHTGEAFNIVTYVRFCGLSREQYIEAQGWENMLDQVPPYHDGTPLYTCGEFVEAIFGDDPELSERVFDRGATTHLCQEGRHQDRYHGFRNDLLYYVGWSVESPEVLEGYHSQYGYKEDDNIKNFVTYFGITREEYIEIYELGDKLDEKAVAHSARAPYTYGQFVDAIYGDDEALSEWVFSADVFFRQNP